MKKLLLSLAFIALLSVPAFKANAILPPTLPGAIDQSKVIFAPEIQPILEPSTEPELTIPYVPIPTPDIVIPPEFLKGPTITDVKMAANDNSVLIEWTTNKLATSKIEYGLTSSYTKSLEDNELVTEHAMAIPASEGELHIRISSSDSLNRRSETEDIRILIPKAPEPTLLDDNAIATSTSNNDTDEMVDTETTSAQESNDVVSDGNATNDIKPLLEINGVETPKNTSNGLSATNAILGGLALLLAGVLIGVLVKTSKKE